MYHLAVNCIKKSFFFRSELKVWLWFHMVPYKYTLNRPSVLGLRVAHTHTIVFTVIFLLL